MIRKLAYILFASTKKASWDADGRVRILVETNDAFSESKWNRKFDENGITGKYQIKFYNDKYNGFKLVSKADALFSFGLNTAFNLINVKMFYSGVSGVQEPENFRGRFHSSRGITRFSVAEYCYNAALYLADNGKHSTFDFKSNEWKITGDEVEAARVLLKRNFGILGLGMNGRAIADKFRNSGCTVFAYDTDKKCADYPVVFCESMEELLKKCDMLFISIKADDYSNEVITAKELSLMPDKSYLINVSRGAVLNEKSLKASLENGKLSGAVLDVTKSEERGKGDATVNAVNLLVTPHIAGNINPYADDIMADFCSKIKETFPDD